jgi:hypothetical protein
VQIELDPNGMDLGEEGKEVLQAAAEPIHRPSHDHVEPSSSGVPAEPIKLRAAVATLGARNAIVGIDSNELIAAALGHGAELALLFGRRLLGRTGADVNGNLHGLDVGSKGVPFKPAKSDPFATEATH